MKYQIIESQNISCPDRSSRIAFVEKFLDIPPNKFGGTAYWPVFTAHNGGYIEPIEQDNGDVVYFHEGKVEKTERRRVSEFHNGTIEFKVFKTTKFTFSKSSVLVEQAESSTHIDGTELDYPDSSGDTYGNAGFGRWNDNSTGIWDWD